MEKFQKEKVYVVTGVGKENSLGTMICKALYSSTITKAKIIAVCQPGIAPASNSKVDSFISCDMSDLDQVQKIFGAIAANHPEIYCLINCAGTNHMEWFPDLKIEDYNKVMNVNCHAPIFAAQALLPSMRGGTILNITSMGAHKPFTTSLAYNVSKAGLTMATKQLARELKKTHNIDVFAIAPNELEGTGMTEANLPEIQRLRGWTPEEAELYRVQSAAAERTDPRFLADYIGYLLKGKKFHQMFNGVEIYYGD